MATNNKTECEPQRGCNLCPRLNSFREENRTLYPSYYNDPVPSFGALESELLIVGLAPGLHGANQTGRPFTGDYAGDLLYATLLHFSFAQGVYGSNANDGLTLRNARISNAVRCVPPQNKPLPDEIRTCRPYLTGTIKAMPRIKAIIALGQIAHVSTISAYNFKPTQFKFAHGAKHDMGNGVMLFDSYHCSRYNTNTRRLTEEMFHAVFAAAKQHIEQ